MVEKVVNEALPLMFSEEELRSSCLFGRRKIDKELRDKDEEPKDRPPLDPDMLNALIRELFFSIFDLFAHLTTFIAVGGDLLYLVFSGTTTSKRRTKKMVEFRKKFGARIQSENGSADEDSEQEIAD
ncbi:hypothetical protein QAD02_021679 [Eretmocerus hayati]|uniref:Uncharacterized protein n=1 Tax=Eretmocerus hayati TaxID=131215 RepID=A0ACC2PST3_9HYME|nr:hypothetical protein QAD02_021679 [Eretmocerus hayati]